MTLYHGAFLNAVSSTVIVSILSCLKRPRGKFWDVVAALVVPFLLANAIYWHEALEAKEAQGPAVFGEYEAWAAVFIVPCFVSGVFPSLAAVFFVRFFSGKMAQVELPTRLPK